MSNFVSILYYRLERIATNLRIFVYSAKIPLPEEGERLKSAEGNIQVTNRVQYGIIRVSSDEKSDLQ
jgi:hypothetical protein